MRIVAITAIAALIVGTDSDAAAQEMKSFHNAVAPLSRLNRQMAEAGLRQIVVRDPLIAP